MINCVVVALFLLAMLSANAQQLTVIKGKVTDAATNEPIPFANVVFKGSAVGTSTDFNGFFKISTKNAKDSLSVIFMGYKSRTKFVQIGKTQTIDFQLMPTSVVLKEVVINSGENPAWRILRKVWASKDSANKDYLDAFKCESYTRIEVGIDNVDNFRNSFLLKSFATVFDSMQVMEGSEGAKILPIFISETVSDLYYHRDPYRRKEYIKATKIMALGTEDGSTASQYAGNIYHDYNFNKDWLSFFEKDFISPISRSGLLFYKYYLVDSMLLDGRFCYEIKVIPKREQDLAFTGTIWIADTVFALKRIVVELGKSANLNWVDRYKIQQDLGPTTSKAWVPIRTRVLVNVSQPTKNTFGIIAKFYIVNRDWVVNMPVDMKFYGEKIDRAEDYKEKNNNYWDTVRPEPLNNLTLRMYSLVDSITNIPKVKNTIKAGKILTLGYMELGKKVEIGPWVMVYGYNEVEGNRLRLGIRTTYKFDKHWVLKSYFAYGTKDDKFKYNFIVERFLSRKNWTIAGIQYKYDVEGMGAIDQFYEKNAVYSTSQQLGLYTRMNENRYYRFYLSSDVFNKKFNERLVVTYRYFNPVGNYVFLYYDGHGNVKSDFNNFEISLESRYAPKEVFLVNDNERISTESKHGAVFTLKTVAGFKDVFHSDFQYQKVSLNVAQRLKLGAWGRTRYSITATKIWGTIPYPLLNIHPGNENWISSATTYNMMGFFEFVSDESLEIMVTHYFGGLFFNRVPLLKKLEWREVVGCNAIFGSLNSNYKNIYPDYVENIKVETFKSLKWDKPYVEISYGIENIARVFRLDMVYRLTYQTPGVPLWRLKGTLSFQF